MGNYKQTAEHAYDLLNHFYKLHLDQIEILGEDNILIYCPNEIFELLAAIELFTKEVIYPTKFMGIDIRAYSGTSIIFGLKEIKK